MSRRKGEKAPTDDGRNGAVTIRPGNKYQVMPPHTPPERAALKATIERD